MFHSTRDLDVAAGHFAKAVSILGIQAVLAVLLRGAPRTYRGGLKTKGPATAASRLWAASAAADSRGTASYGDTAAPDRRALLAPAGADAAYVSAVLERADPGALEISAPEGLSVSASQGTVVVSAERIELSNRQRLRITGADVDICARWSSRVACSSAMPALATLHYKGGIVVLPR